MEALWIMLMGLAEWVAPAMAWIGLVLTTLVGAIQLSPWKGDDAALADVKKMPVVGSLVAFLLGKSPLNKK